VTQLKKLADLYSYTDLIKNSGSPYNIQVDLVAELDSIAGKVYSNDFEFHMALSELFSRLNDAHCYYNPPQGYLSFVACFPYAFLVTSPSTSNIVFTAGGTYNCYTRTRTKTGQVLLSIDGTSPLEWFKGFGRRFVKYILFIKILKYIYFKKIN
jgi:hypothetical protein